MLGMHDVPNSCSLFRSEADLLACGELSRNIDLGRREGLFMDDRPFALILPVDRARRIHEGLGRGVLGSGSQAVAADKEEG